MTRPLRGSVIVLALAGCQSDPSPTQPDLRIRPELCGLVRAGMTRGEVAAAIGGPPGFYEGTCGASWDPSGPSPRLDKGDLHWTGREGTIEVTFGADGRAIDAKWYRNANVSIR